MKYTNIYPAKFISRPNRFIANVEIDGRIETVHVKNTGRCRELLIPGVSVMLEKSNNPSRKTLYDLVMVYKEGLGWVNIDSQMPNYLVKEWLMSNPWQFRDITMIKPECSYGNSRVDFYIECQNRKILMEVKGVTLEMGGIGYFPDAPTQRGIKHINELIKATTEGYEAYLAFVIQMNGIKEVRPNINTHPEFGEAMDRAVKAGVQVLFLECEVKTDEVIIKMDKFDLSNMNNIKIWLDDVRAVPEGYVLAKSVDEAIALIEQIEAMGKEIEVIDLDHDLGDYAPYGGDGINLLDYLVENEKFYNVKFHTANPVGRANMERMVQRFWP